MDEHPIYFNSRAHEFPLRAAVHAGYRNVGDGVRLIDRSSAKESVGIVTALERGDDGIDLVIIGRP